jgi:hypothetical protein
MSTSNSNVGIKDSWSLQTFRDKFEKMKVTNDMVNKETGEVFKDCAFIDSEGKVTLVGFSAALGELTPAQIKEQKDSLQVVLLESGNYKLCKVGADSWEDVDI